MKFLALILTSHDPMYAKLAAESVRFATRYARHEYDVGIVVNSKNPNYFAEVRNVFHGDTKIKLFQTESNGHPGKGHNSQLDVFRKLKEYDYLVKIDGDDLLHPSALNLMEEAIDMSPGLDVLGLQAHEKIMTLGIKTLKYPLTQSSWIAGYFDEVKNRWKNVSFPDPIVTFFGKCSVPARPVLFSRKSLDSGLLPKIQYTDEGRLADMTVFLTCIHHMDQGSINFASTSSNYIYLVNALCGASVTNTGQRDWTFDDNAFRTQLAGLNLPAHLWSIIPEIPYLDIPNPSYFRTTDKIYFTNRYLDLLHSSPTLLFREPDRWRPPAPKPLTEAIPENITVANGNGKAEPSKTPVATSIVVAGNSTLG